MRAVWILAGILAAASAVCSAQQGAQEEPGKLVREVVYNELHDHDLHGYWRYWVERHSPNDVRVEEQVETSDGPIARAVSSNGQPVSEQVAEKEETRLRELASSPGERANLRQSYRDDEKRVGRILAMLPDAFAFQDEGTDNGIRHLRFSPSPSYSAHCIEARVFHQLSGDLFIDVRMKRMKKLEGHLNDNVDFGMGLLGRVNKGGWFRMVRTQVSPTEWKTERLEVHMNGRALLFKTLAHDTSEVRGGFEAVPPKMSLEQGLRVLNETVAARQAGGQFSPVAMLRSAGASD
ncbi:MAG TPA: hypothetical protein VKB38_02525 [Terracidiphilus sp.]|nr:hypothetical protein [Terracidiphilus sp.]